MEELLRSIANSIKDYRNGELSKPTVDHIEKWSSQFSDDNRLIVLQETDHILRQFYLTYDNLIVFLRGLVKNSKLTGDDPLNFWGKVHFFSEQKNGNSQQHMVGELRSQIADMLSINPITSDEHTDTYVYIDGNYTGVPKTRTLVNREKKPFPNAGKCLSLSPWT